MEDVTDVLLLAAVPVLDLEPVVLVTLFDTCHPEAVSSKPSVITCALVVLAISKDRAENSSMGTTFCNLFFIKLNWLLAVCLLLAKG